MDVGEFHDWEVLPDATESGIVKSVVQNSSDLEGIERDSEGIIRPDYFSLDSQPKYAVSEGLGDVTDDGSVLSDNPSWIDPGSEARYSMKEFWPDLSSDRSSDDGKYGEFEGKSELGIVESSKIHEGFDAISTESDDNSVLAKFENFMEKSEISIHDDDLGEDKLADVPEEAREQEGENENVAIEAMKTGSEEGNGNSLRGVVWWKLPLDLLRYCVFRGSPVWTISVVAAMMGFVILGRRLYKMKRKSRSLQLKVTVDDKKVSQFMSRAARLNEAFSVVKRVPIIRPSLPVAGVAPWPMMSLR